MRSYLASLVAVFAIACHSSKPATTPTPTVADPAPTEPDASSDPASPPTPTPLSNDDADRMFADTLDFLDALATAVDGNQKDCKAMAGAMTKVLDAHGPLLTLARTYTDDADVNAKADVYMNAHAERVSAAVGKLGPGLQACGSDADVAAAMKQFDTM